METSPVDDLDQSSFNVNLNDCSVASFHDAINDSFDDLKINDEIPNERQRIRTEDITVSEGPDQFIAMEPLKIVKFIRVLSEDQESHIPFELRNGPLAG